MKVEVRNLGEIKEASIDLKPLTIFVGPNNAGKTWLAYTLAGCFGPYGWERYVDAYLAGKTQDTYQVIDQAIQQAMEEGNAKIDIVKFAEEHGEEYFNNVVRIAKRWLRQFMNTDRITFGNLELKVALDEAKNRWMGRVQQFSLNSRTSTSTGTHQSLLTLFKEAEKRDIFIITSTEGVISEKLPATIIRSNVFRNIFRMFDISLYSNTFTFPVERAAYLSLPFNLLRKSAPGATSTLESDSTENLLDWPTSKFLRMIDTISYVKKSEKVGKGQNALNEYQRLSELLENHILSGKVDFSTSDPLDIRREILFTPTDGDAMEVSIASSMVKELSSLVLYLRYLANAEDWLIIDEPEMNLHPEAQARLTEFLAMLVNAGLHILLTTHSPYIVDHLANLMKAAQSPDTEAVQEKFYLRQKEAFINKEKVSVYQIEEGVAKNILDEDGIIHWDTFSNVSDKVTEIYFEL